MKQDIKDLLIEHANIDPSFEYDPNSLEGVERQAAEIFEQLLDIFIQKGRLYGNHRLSMPTSPADYQAKMLYGDIERKFRRYQFFTWHDSKPGTPLVLETLGDMIVHALIAMIVLDRDRTS